MNCAFKLSPDKLELHKLLAAAVAVRYFLLNCQSEKILEILLYSLLVIEFTGSRGVSCE